jgi:hypothetical protein
MYNKSQQKGPTRKKIGMETHWQAHTIIPHKFLAGADHLNDHFHLCWLITQHLTMQIYSEQQGILWDLFLMLLFIHHQETNDLLDSTMNIRTVPSIRQVAPPINPGCALVLDLLFKDESRVLDPLHMVL